MSITTLYQLNFALMQHHKWSLTELEEMYPFERDIYTGLLENYLKKDSQNDAPTLDQL